MKNKAVDTDINHQDESIDADFELVSAEEFFSAYEREMDLVSKENN